MAYWRYVAKWGAFAAVICGWAAYSLRHSPDAAFAYAITVVAVANLSMLVGLCLYGLFGRPHGPSTVRIWARHRIRLTLCAARDRLRADCAREPTMLHCFLWRDSDEADRGIAEISAAIRARRARDASH